MAGKGQRHESAITGGTERRSKKLRRLYTAWADLWQGLQ
jgi:hypothetical protein